MAERGIQFRGAAGLLLVLAPLLVCLAAEVIILVMVTNALGWWTVALLIFTTLLGCWRFSGRDAAPGVRCSSPWAGAPYRRDEPPMRCW